MNFPARCPGSSGRIRESRAVWKFFWRPGKRGLSSGQLQAVTSYLAIMLGCGLDLIQALVVLTESGELITRQCAQQLVRDVESGMKFSQAMSRQPETFSSTYRRVVETAEETGKLASTMARLSLTLERQSRTTKRLQSALVYPVCLLVCSLLLVAGMLYYVFPLLLKVTQDAGVEPPPLTRLLILLASKKLALGLLITGLLIGGRGAPLLEASALGPSLSAHFRRAHSAGPLSSSHLPAGRGSSAGHDDGERR